MTDPWQAGDAYEPYMGRWSALVAVELLAWLDLGPGLRWLDVGCGTGALTAAIAAGRQPDLVVGVDPSPGFLGHARSRLAQAPARFVAGDALALPVSDGAVDATVSALALNFVPDRPAALRELCRATRLGGDVAAYVWDYSGGMEMLSRFWDAAVALAPEAAPLHEGTRFGFCRPEALHDLFSDAGLSAVEVVPLVVPTRFRDFDDFWSPFLGGQGPAPAYVAGLGEAERAALAEALRTALPVGVDGSLALTARAWGVRGRRWARIEDLCPCAGPAAAPMFGLCPDSFPTPPTAGSSSRWRSACRCCRTSRTAGSTSPGTRCPTPCRSGATSRARTWCCAPTPRAWSASSMPRSSPSRPTSRTPSQAPGGAWS